MDSSSDSIPNLAGEIQSLLSYQSPVAVKKQQEQYGDGPTIPIPQEEPQEDDNESEVDTKQQIEDTLNMMFPPRCWEENGKSWQQKISLTPATRQDIIQLEEMLDARLEAVHARETGICPHRRALYAQCFDEMIRQVTITCIERGLLLLRVRDEMNLTIGAYEALYTSAVAYGLKKATESHKEKEELREKIMRLEQKKEDLRLEFIEMQNDAAEDERRAEEIRVADERRYAEEIAQLKKTNSQLKSQLEGILNPKK